MNKGLPKIEVGDKICSRGITKTVAVIDDQYQDWDPKTQQYYYGFEGFTTDGVYRSWKQYFDGGYLIKKGTN